MDRCALFVDAGYALADGAFAVHGTRNRDSVSWDYAGLLKLLGGLARDRTGLPLLRCYWYDTSADGSRGDEHELLADIPGLKLRLSKQRLGRKEGAAGEIRRDLTALARNRAIGDVIVVSADEDLAPVIAEVQDLGMRAVALQIVAPGIDPAASRALRQECDDLIEVSAVHLRPYADLIAGAEPQLTGSASRELAAATISGPQPAIEAQPQPGYRVASQFQSQPLGGVRERDADQRAKVPAQPAAAGPVQSPVPTPREPERGSGPAHTSGPVSVTAHGGTAQGGIAQGGAVAGSTERGRPAGPGPDDGRPGYLAPAASTPGVSGPGVNGPGVNGPGVNGAGVNGAGAAGPSAGGPAAGGIGAGGPAGPAAAGQVPVGYPAPQQSRPDAAGSGFRHYDQNEGRIPGADRGTAVPYGMGSNGMANGLEPNGLAPNGSGSGSQHGNGVAGHYSPHNGISGLQNGMPGAPQNGMPGAPQNGMPAPYPPPGGHGAAPAGNGREPAAAAGGAAGQMPPAYGGYGGNGGAAYGGMPAAPHPQSSQGQHALPPAPQQPARPSRPPQLPSPYISEPYGGPAQPASFGPPPAAPYQSPYGGQASAPPSALPAGMPVGDAVQSAHAEGFGFGEAVASDAPALWLEAVLARKPRMPSDLEARLLQGSALPIDSLLHDEVRHALRRGFWDALERSRH